MPSISVIKNTDCTLKFKCFDTFLSKKPIDLTIFKNFIFAVTESGKLLIEKKLNTNDIFITTELDGYNPYIVNVKFNNMDTKNLSTNPHDEEKVRIYELFAITTDNSVQRLIFGNFYLEPTGYYHVR